MKRIDELFEVKYGVNLELNALTITSKQNDNAINFVSRTSKNNGVSAVVELLSDVSPLPKGTLSVATGGSVLETFLQPEPYYSGRDLYCLIPKFSMNDSIKLFYCECIRANKYRYNYGRQANKTLKSILVPDICEIPSWIVETVIPKFDKINSSVNDLEFLLNTKTWQSFEYDKIFHIQRGASVYLQDMKTGPYPYVSATSINNGISAYVDVFNRKGELIVLNYDGSIGEAFYQEYPFFASEKVVTLSLKGHKFNKYIAMFIITLLRQEKYRYNYGLKWSVNSRMKKSKIYLPCTKEDTPDWNHMEQYIKSLSYSASI